MVGANEGYALRAMLWTQLHVHGHLLRDERSSRMGVIGACTLHMHRGGKYKNGVIGAC